MQRLGLCRVASIRGRFGPMAGPREASFAAELLAQREDVTDVLFC
jgi:hypothetical protein